MNEEKNLKTMWSLILATALVLFLVIFLGVLIWNQVKQHDYIGRTDQQVYTITINGEGKVTAIPDIAEVSVGVQTDKSKVADAQKENTDKMNKLIAGLKDLKIDSKDIKTSSYNIYPRYDYSSSRQTLIGYTVSQSVTVKIRDLEQVSKVLDLAGSGGANQVGSLNFTIDDPENIKQDAREKALANAKEKAEALAKVAGVKLGRLVSFSESSSGGYPIAYREYFLDSSMKTVAGSAPTVEPGSQDVIVDVMVTYEVL
ncbi:MAG: SIMPL domain-containing protein [Candidatus Buchananbacteria bacterium]|nr:SIMPL domain-containing protein [Candidatus Buchananbacteria bacterium]